MQTKRIIRIQRRAKRRILALAIVAAVFVGYNALSLFAEEERPSQLPVAKLSTAPGVKSVGIRMINPSGISQTARKDAMPMTASVPVSPVMPAFQLLPPATSLATQKVEHQLPPPFPIQAESSNAPTQSAATPGFSATGFSPLGFSELPAPPPMSDVLAKNPKGKVVMKLGGSEHEKESLPNQNTSANGLSQPNSNGEIGTPHGQSALPVGPATVRISLADSGMQDQFAPSSNENRNAVQPLNRTPQLVRSKPTKIAHTVVLAQSTNLESQRSTDQPYDSVPTVEVDASLVPHSISNGLVGPSTRTGMSKTSKQASVKGAVEDAFVSLAPPARNSSQEPQLLDKRGIVSSKENSIESAHRKFDSRAASQSPIATIDLECLTATTMNLPGKLVAIAVQDESVCKAMHNGRTVSLVGNQTGTTLVQIWTADLGEKPQVVRVNVLQKWGKAQATRNEVKDIKQVIQQGFPRADVNIVSKEDGVIEVQGTTDTEESAKRILELVRKLYLVPVKDRLTVSN